MVEEEIKGILKVRRVTLSEKAKKTYIALEDLEGNYAGTLTLKDKHDELIEAKEVKILGGE